jgi:hypothetical protein
MPSSAAVGASPAARAMPTNAPTITHKQSWSNWWSDLWSE